MGETANRMFGCTASAFPMQCCSRGPAPRSELGDFFGGCDEGRPIGRMRRSVEKIRHNGCKSGPRLVVGVPEHIRISPYRNATGDPHVNSPGRWIGEIDFGKALDALAKKRGVLLDRKLRWIAV